MNPRDQNLAYTVRHWVKSNAAGQLAMPLGKESPFIFSKFHPLNADTPLVRTVSLAPSVYRINGVWLWLYVRVCYSHKAARYPKHSARSATRHQYLLVLFGRNNKIQKRRQITGNMAPFPTLPSSWNSTSHVFLIFPNIWHKKILQVFRLSIIWKAEKFSSEYFEEQKRPNCFKRTKQTSRERGIHA